MNSEIMLAHLRAGKAYGQIVTCGIDTGYPVAKKKVDYKTERRAYIAVSDMSVKSDKPLEHYPCYFCLGWHIGRKMSDEELAKFHD